MKPPKAVALLWWQRGIVDGMAAAKRRRGRYFEDYKAKAIEALDPQSLIGPCECVYRCAFRYGFDAGKLQRERRNTFLPRPTKRVKTLALPEGFERVIEED